MLLSVIIPALNEANSIAAAVKSALAVSAYEVLVVDGGSTDETTSLAQQHGARVLTGPRGRGVQQNQGAAVAAGDVLLFLHADCRLAPDVGKQIEEILVDRTIPGGAFCQRIEADGWIYRGLELGNAFRVRWQQMPYGDQGIFIRRTVFEQLGRFPEVALMEDLLLMQGLRHLGRPVLLPGPIYVSPRRWQRHGVFRQTLRNWSLLVARRLGVSPNRLAKYYAPQ